LFKHGSQKPFGIFSATERMKWVSLAGGCLLASLGAIALPFELASADASVLVQRTASVSSGHLEPAQTEEAQTLASSQLEPAPSGEAANPAGPAASGHADEGLDSQPGHIVREEPEDNILLPRCAQPKNLLVFFDGSYHTEQGSLWKLRKYAVESMVQYVHYEPGVYSENGFGLRVRGLRGYKFLADNYCDGDRIFIFGQSRGCFSARYLQGVMHMFGLPGMDWNVDIEKGQPWGDPDYDKFEKILGNTPGRRGANVEALTCMDGVLRALWDSSGHDRSTARLHMAIAPLVKHFFHALAMEEAQGFMQGAELLMVNPNVTTEEQVWFMGDHEILCSENDIVLSWMVDRLSPLGVLMSPRFASLLQVNFRVGIPWKAPSRWTTLVRNPARCRKELYGNRPVLVHQSVKDRMEGVAGWVPWTACCFPEALLTNVEWVTTGSYEASKQYTQDTAQWIIVTFDLTMPASQFQKRYLLMSSKHGDHMQAIGVQPLQNKVLKALTPFSTLQGEEYPTVSIVEGPCKPCSYNSVYMNASIGAGPCKACSAKSVEVDNGARFQLHEAGLVTDNGTFQSMLYGMEGSIEISKDDLAASEALGTSFPARCVWLMSTDGDACRRSLGGEKYADTCSEVQVEALTGELHSVFDGMAVEKYMNNEDRWHESEAHSASWLKAAKAFRGEWRRLPLADQQLGSEKEPSMLTGAGQQAQGQSSGEAPASTMLAKSLQQANASDPVGRPIRET